MSGEIINFLFNGTLNGAVFSLIALGYSLVYGVGHLMNLAHGAYFMITGYFLLWFLNFTPSIPLLNVLLVLLIITIIGGLTYVLLIKPLQDTNVGVVLVTFGLAFFLEQLALIISGTTSYAINDYMIFPGTTEIGGYSMINQYIFLIIISLVIVSSFALFINKSKLGKSIRAVSQDREAATLMGINANRILFYTVMISAFLAGIAAILYLPAAAINGPSMGWTFLTNSFAVVILGGMGSLVGSVVGAYIVGFVTSFTNLFIPNGPSWAHLVPIIVIVIMLLIRPQGLFGKKEVT
ncbi:MAG: branched-chain amino acid ABC transporter permease [Candidatus Thorarchaeota archaeon]